MAPENTANNGGRSFDRIMDDMRQSSFTFKQPADLIILLGYSVNLYAAIRIAVESGIFRVLSASKDPVKASDLSSRLDDVSGGEDDEKKADREEYVIRMCRAVGGMSLLDEIEPGVYQANELTHTLADPGFDLGIRELFDGALGPHSTLSHMTDWGKEKGWTAPERAANGPYQQARGIVGTNTFRHWVQSEPHQLSRLSALMKVIQRDRLNWSEWFPADALFTEGSESGDVPFIVDVGAGLAHDLMGLASRYPDKKVRFVAEDLPSVIAETREEKLDSRIELVEHDFFQAQPIKGAKIYFMHKIMHDWPDFEDVQILTHIRDAMAADSRIFINDCILPDQGSPLLFSAFDLCMFVQLNAKERSETMWKRLISKVGGLEVRKFWQAPEMKGEGIVEVVKV
ncbi:uncharacterized protein LTR77_004096 [Saxophila tyrrhenica]|uniref:O-methyltransferase C-terminal domain-containing protein n=1 Tax=Saxophila tyrrhenica TaxID=1690608 RepID=A0AAV9PF46_9PEZI|nr:hypothetical protein LTR77_004096 [Saxophila tyrrhenica]